MNPSLRAIAVDLAELADQRNAPAAACLARRVVEGPRSPANALLVLLDADASGLAAWIEKTLPGAALTTVRDNSTQAALELWRADKVVIAFPCGGLPTSDTLVALANGPLQRQPMSAVVVLIGAEAIESADDLALVESTTRRWLLAPNADGDPPRDVHAAGAYLWSRRTDTESAFSPLLARDRDALVRWLRTPLSSETLQQLDRARLHFALALLEDARHDSAEAKSIEKLDRRTVYRLQDDLANLKSRVLARLRSDSEQLEMAVQQAVEDLERMLFDGLGAVVEEVSGTRHRPETAIPQRIGHYCDDCVRAWLGGQQRLADQWRQALASLKGLLGQQDWASIAAATGTSDYPERLLTVLSERSGNDWMMDNVPRETGPIEEAALLPASSHPLRWSLATLGTGMLGVAAAAASGCGVLGMAVVGAATSTAAAGYQWRASRGDLRAEADLYGRQVIGDLVARIRRQAPNGISDLAGELRLQLVAEFDRLQELLDGLLRSQAPSSESEREDTVRDIRDRLNRVLAQETTQDS